MNQSLKCNGDHATIIGRRTSHTPHLKKMSNKVFFKQLLFKGSLFKTEVESYISIQNISSKNVKQEIESSVILVNFRTTNQFLS